MSGMCFSVGRSFLVLFAIFAGLGGAQAQSKVDFQEIVKSVVMLESHVPATARTARTLGTKRVGSGIVIDEEGLVLTIGYLIMESEEISILNHMGSRLPASFVAYDHSTGFGLIRALTPIGVTPMGMGASKAMTEKSLALAVSLGDSRPVTPVQVVSRRPFAGAWEYLLDSAIYTMPPHLEFGGAALINEQGQLVGVGSLFVNDAMEIDEPTPGNMFVPVDILKPILADLKEKGRRSEAPGPWLGIYTAHERGRVFVTRVARSGPAEKAGIKPGDIVMGVSGKRVSNMVDFFERVRESGSAGVDVEIDVLPMGGPALEIKKVVVKSQDRHDWLTQPQSH